MKYPFLVILFLSSLFVQAQFVLEKQEIKDSIYTIPMITVSYAYQWTGSDMASRFGANSNVGGSFAVKTKTNWYYGFKGNFIFGGKVKETDLLADLQTSDGTLIDNEGKLVDVYLGERGSSFFLIGGRLINKFTPNKNSGILLYSGFGMLQHKISIKYQGSIPSLTDEYKKGYDRFSVGYAANGFVGYLFLSKNRLLNFFGGFDYTIGWTKNWRKYNYDTQQLDEGNHTNVLYGVRVGWIIRLNKRQQQDFYFN
ncbi:MAG: hypothetical protein COX70_08645 [Flavobacteriales bacterium CG_4_10_14_0_2_um_filter_32_8]|nr:MAG: hypothetical protein COX70_08645 [Flavobacteriales bacterium CG_4_10_14_0_2_um_filter_32_8]